MNSFKQILEFMYKRGDELSLEYIAKKIETPQEILEDLSKHNSCRIRCGVAINPATPKDILIILSKDKDHYVRFCVNCNKNSPEEALINIKKLNMCM